MPGHELGYASTLGALRWVHATPTSSSILDLLAVPYLQGGVSCNFKAGTGFCPKFMAATCCHTHLMRSALSEGAHLQSGVVIVPKCLAVCPQASSPSSAFLSGKAVSRPCIMLVACGSWC